MSDPAAPLQIAVVSLLSADSQLHAEVDDRVFDEIPAKAEFPYLRVGEGSIDGDDDDCSDVSEITFEIHVFTRPPRAGQAMRRIAGLVRDAMKAPLALQGFDILVQDFQQTRWLDDPDGKTRHAVVQFRFIIVHS